MEEPLEIRIGGDPFVVIMRTPGHDQELAAGFLLTEGLIQQRSDMTALRPLMRKEGCHSVNVSLNRPLPANSRRNLIISSSCGLCGKESIEAVLQRFPPLTETVTLAPEVLVGLPEQLRRAQASFDKTGGLHAAAIFDLQGKLVVLREDIGRHNAVDKVIGYALMAKMVPLTRHLLLVSGRASFEIMQKALAARIPVVAAVSAASSLAVEFAEQSGQTLVGFLRGGRFNVYSRAEALARTTTTTTVPV